MDYRLAKLPRYSRETIRNAAGLSSPMMNSLVNNDISSETRTSVPGTDNPDTAILIPPNNDHGEDVSAAIRRAMEVQCNVPRSDLPGTRTGNIVGVVLMSLALLLVLLFAFYWFMVRKKLASAVARQSARMGDVEAAVGGVLRRTEYGPGARARGGSGSGMGPGTGTASRGGEEAPRAGILKNTTRDGPIELRDMTLPREAVVVDAGPSIQAQGEAEESVGSEFMRRVREVKGG